jgi:hypothetical protein
MQRHAVLLWAISLILVTPLFATAKDMAAKVAAQKNGAQDN